MESGIEQKTKVFVSSESPAFLDYAKKLCLQWPRHVFPDKKHPRYALFAAKTYEEASKGFHQYHPDVVLLDASQPWNRELCEMIRSYEEERHTGVIFINPFLDQAPPIDAPEAFRLGADDYVSPDKLPAEILARIECVTNLKAMTDRLRQANHQLETLSITDDLTGLFNMRYLQQYLKRTLDTAKAHKKSFGVVMMDLDRFKSINDSTNHLVGSYILAEIGRLLRLSKVFSDHSCLARYGGDEFIIVTEVADLQSLVTVCEKVRQLIKEASFHRDGHVIKMTVSIGACFVEPNFHGDVNDPVKCADMMLYKSKNEGRDRVSHLILRSQDSFKEVESSIHLNHEKPESALRYKTIQAVPNQIKKG